MKLVASDLPVGDLIKFADTMIKNLGVSSPEEAKEVLENLNNDGRGVPFTKFCNSRNWNQKIAYESLYVLGMIDEKKQVTNEALNHFDGDRKEDIVFINDFTLYNTPNGTLMINMDSPSIARLTGEFVGCEDKGYNEDFRKRVNGNGKTAKFVATAKGSGFKNLKRKYG